MVWLLLTILVLYVTMVYGTDRGNAGRECSRPTSAIRRCRCPITSATAGSGAFLPPIAFALVAFKGDIYYGLWYPIVIAVITLVVGTLFLRETKDVDIYANT